MDNMIIGIPRNGMSGGSTHQIFFIIVLEAILHKPCGHQAGRRAVDSDIIFTGIYASCHFKKDRNLLRAP